MKTDGKSTREKVHLGSGQLTTNPKHTVIRAGNQNVLLFCMATPNFDELYLRSQTELSDQLVL